MRVLLVGSAAERARLRQQLGSESIEVAGEFASLSAARAAAADVDGIIIATPVEDEDAVPDPLTARELEVLELLVQGITSNRKLAKELGVSENTVKFHVRNILDKLHLHNRAQVVSYAIRNRIVDPPV